MTRYIQCFSIAVVMVLLLVVVGCGQDQAQQEKLKSKPVQPAAVPKISEAVPLQLMRRSGCFSCHRLDTKLVGPPFLAVANRYRGDSEARERLIEKVKNGGAGNWTEITGGIAMPPNSPRVSDENIGKLVDFILSLAE